jgi:hypothetical protein
MLLCLFKVGKYPMLFLQHSCCLLNSSKDHPRPKYRNKPTTSNLIGVGWRPVPSFDVHCRHESDCLQSATNSLYLS